MVQQWAAARCRPGLGDVGFSIGSGRARLAIPFKLAEDVGETHQVICQFVDGLQLVEYSGFSFLPVAVSTFLAIATAPSEVMPS